MKKTILVVCHDAGGAELISAYVKANAAKVKFICLAVGPAIKIFKRKSINLAPLAEPETVLKKYSPDLVLTGTSWASDIELRFIKSANNLKIKTASYLDHWVNYRERFGFPEEKWRYNLPDEIWAGDKYALAKAKKIFLKSKVKYVKNKYFEEIKEQYKKLKKINQAGVLVICEPIDGKKELDIIGQIINFLIENGYKVILRLHPSEVKNKYDKLILKNNLVVKSKNSLIEDIASVKTVIGMQSMALAVAIICGKKTISFLSDKKLKCVLPFKEIIKTKNLNKIYG